MKKENPINVKILLLSEIVLHNFFVNLKKQEPEFFKEISPAFFDRGFPSFLSKRYSRLLEKTMNQNNLIELQKITGLSAKKIKYITDRGVPISEIKKYYIDKNNKI